MDMKRQSILLLLLSLVSVSVHASQFVVLGLFQDRAMIKVDNRTHLYRVGQPPVNGLQLLEANARGAVVSLGGEVMNVNLVEGRGVRLERIAEDPSISIRLQEDGLYRTNGTINGQGREFVIDTGANRVALTTRDATELGVEYDESTAHPVLTANGRTVGYRVVLDEIAVGQIKVRNVEATIVENDTPIPVLLGMAFLKQVDVDIRGDMMRITGKAEGPYLAQN